MGAHEPPTNRSFYLSLAASTLRFAIIVALVVGGIVLINQAFPEAGEGGSGPPIGGTTTATTPPVTPTETPDGATGGTRTPQIVGVRIAVFNGTERTGLAGETTTTLVDEYGYVAVEPADAPSPVAVTTIYYRRNRDRIEAEFLAGDFFKRLDVRVAKLDPDADVDPEVQLAIYLGNDYAALRD